MIGFAEIFRLHRVEHQGQADKQRIYRNDRRLSFPASEAGSNALKTQAAQGFAGMEEYGVEATNKLNKL